MKNKFIIGLSAAALIVLIVVQYIFITETFRTKKQQFDFKYGNLVQRGMSDFSWDSILTYLDSRALELLYPELDTGMSTPYKVFYQILSGYGIPDDHLTRFIRQAGEEPDFESYIQINSLYLLDGGVETQVYQDSSGLPPRFSESLIASSIMAERNFFRLDFDYYIDFNYRSRQVLKEMRLILLLSILTLVFIVSVFYMTLRNLLFQTRLSEMKSDFINNMTHELKTPLSTISVASSSLGDEKMIRQKERVRELSEIIKKQNRHLTHLIDRILDINIWERDQVKLKKSRIRVIPWIREKADLFLLEQHTGNVQIDTTFQTEVESISLDEVHFKTVLDNLFSNAVKYGGDKCHIGVKVTSDDQFLVIEIADDGPGIPKEEQKHVFEKFYRGRDTKEKVIKGLGLGLYYVRTIVLAHHGTISLSGSPGKGAVFTIKLPIHDEPVTG